MLRAQSTLDFVPHSLLAVGAALILLLGMGGPI
jgi:hypothetical protein